MFKARSLIRFFYKAFKSFIRENGIDKAAILAYYSIFSSLFLITFFVFLFARFIKDPHLVLQTVYPFSDEFFSSISPEILGKAIDLSTKIEDFGTTGALFFLFLGFLMIKKIVQFVNDMFMVEPGEHFWEKRFLFSRLREFSLLLIFGALAFVSFLGTSVLTTIKGIFENKVIMGKVLDPFVTEHLSGFFLLFILPLSMSFLFLLVLYKWIPAAKVYLKGAVISALITALLWEAVKRGYTFYLVRYSIMGKLHGPIIAIILFGFWMEISMAIMLFGAKLTYLFDQEKKHETV